MWLTASATLIINETARRYVAIRFMFLARNTADIWAITLPAPTQTHFYTGGTTTLAHKKRRSSRAPYIFGRISIV